MKTRFDTRPQAIEVDLQSAAVVVVDMQNAFAAKGGMFDLAGRIGEISCRFAQTSDTMTAPATDKEPYVNCERPSDGASKRARLEFYNEIKLPTEGLPIHDMA